VSGLTFGADGTIVVGLDMMTGHSGLFAGGDAIAGERSVTIAVGHGKRAARNIDAWLRGARYQASPKAPIVSFEMLRPPVYSDADPSPQRTNEAAKRIDGFDEVVSGLNATAARYEAQRCLSCGNCFECDNCFAACPETAIVRLGPTHGYRVDMDLCTGCAVCVEQCPCHAMEMVAEDAHPISLVSTSRAEGAVR
jgi:Pyruvate/2-oxoacid:ferredoxin oxidoreductase delta subunit